MHLCAFMQHPYVNSLKSVFLCLNDIKLLFSFLLYMFGAFKGQILTQSPNDLFSHVF